MDVLTTNLSEFHGFYGSEVYVGSLGGQIQQIYYVLNEICNKFPNGLKTYLEKKLENTDEEYCVRPNNLRELVVHDHLLQFMMSYLKDMQNESIDLFLHPNCAALLKDEDCDLDDLSSLTEETLKKFKACFIENRSRSYQGNSAHFDLLLEVMIEILAKRVPTDGEVKIDDV